MWRYAIRKVAPAAIATTTAAVLVAGTTTVYYLSGEDDNVNDDQKSSYCRLAPSLWNPMLPFIKAVHCEAPNDAFPPDAAPPELTSEEEEEEEDIPHIKQAGFQHDADGDYHGLFPMRQLWKPAVEYPLW